MHHTVQHYASPNPDALHHPLELRLPCIIHYSASPHSSGCLFFSVLYRLSPQNSVVKCVVSQLHLPGPCITATVDCSMHRRQPPGGKCITITLGCSKDASPSTSWWKMHHYPLSFSMDASSSQWKMHHYHSQRLEMHHRQPLNGNASPLLSIAQGMHHHLSCLKMHLSFLRHASRLLLQFR